MLSDLFGSDAQGNSDRPTSIRSQIIARILADVKPRLTKLVDEIEDDTINHELDLRRHTDAQLEEDLDDYRIDIASTKEDALAEVCHEVEKITEEFLNETNEKVRKLSEDVQVLIDDAFVDLHDRLKELVEEKKPSLQGYVREMVGQSDMPDTGGKHWYLRSGVQPTSITLSELRSILLKHGLSCPSSTTKPQLVDLFANEVPSEARIATSRDISKASSQRRATSVPL